MFHGQSTFKIGTDAVLLAALAPLGGVRSVLDIGCGCGVVGFCVADRLLHSGTPFVSLAGLDVDADSIAECERNAAMFPQKSDVTFQFHCTPVQKWQTSEKFDLVVSNPPFFAHSLKPADGKRSVARHCDDTLPFADLVDCAARFLSLNGSFCVILPYIESVDFQQIASQKLHLSAQIDVRPTPHKPLNRRILCYRFAPSNPQLSELTIRTPTGTYSQQYRELTQSLLL